MEVSFTPELQAKLERAVAEIQADYLEHDLWFRQKVAAAGIAPSVARQLTHG